REEMQLIRTFSYRIKDSVAMKHLCRTAGCVNFVWNYINATSHRAISERHQWLSAPDLDKLLTGTSKLIPELHSQTIQAITKEYVTSRKQHRKAKLRWRSAKRKTLGWIPFKASGVRLADDTITYRGISYRFWKSRDWPQDAKLVTGSFNQDSRGRWYVNLQFKWEVKPPKPEGEQKLGIDLGLKTLVTCSDGTRYERENLTRQSEEKLALAQRANKKKQVKALHAKVKNKRKDWNHKVSTDLVKRCELIRVGNVSSGGLKKTKMAKSVSDAGWFQLKTMLKNKALMQGVDFGETNEAYSTVTCSVCLKRTGPRGLLGLGVREWECSGCGAKHDRDVNGARNILVFGLVGQPDAGCVPTSRVLLNSGACGSKKGQQGLFPLGRERPV
ncbi:MAG: transposase, partial [Myxococcota bacterium]